MKNNGKEPFEFEDWKEKYREVLCLKETEDKQTWLLEEKHGTGRWILKKAAGEQGQFLRAEYELLQELSKEKKSIRPGVTEFKSTEEWSYLLREYVQGVTVRELVEQEGVLTPSLAAEFLQQLCKQIAIFHHHKPPVIHRDIKPENIIVTAMGRIRLIDFETARNYKPKQQEDTVCIGTRGYAAPEQFGFGQTDVRTDIYGAGKVLLYMVTAGCGEEDIQLLKTGWEKRLKKIILRCCAYAPDKRYQSIEQLEKALFRFLKFSGYTGKSLCALWGIIGIMSLSITGLGLRLYQMEQREGRSQAGAKEETIPVWEKSGTPGEAGSWNSWNPHKYEEDVRAIVQKVSERDEAGTAHACEALVEKLSLEECIIQTESIPFEELTGEELTAYHTSIGRMGYEYIADRLSCGEGRIVRQIGNYELKGKEIIKYIREDIEYFYMDSDGEEMKSALYQYVVEGDDSPNMDGCIVEILDALSRALQE